MKLKSKNGYSAFISALAALGLSACNGVNSAPATGIVLGQDGTQGTPAVIPPETVQDPAPDTGADPTPAPPAGPTVVGNSCHSDDPNQICLSLNYVVYTDSKDAPVVTEVEAINNISEINNVWKQCNIAFEIGQLQAVDPTQHGLTFNTANNSELDKIRKVFQNDTELLVVTTGKWDRSGSLGSTGANAWANMPGYGLYGVVMESAVGTYSNIIAHELGHYLNLDHMSNSSDLMNPIIYDTSTMLTSSQCSAARASVTGFWKKMTR